MKVIDYISLSALMLALIVPMVITFTNPSLTDAQLFIEFWPVYLADLALVGFSLFLSHKS